MKIIKARKKDKAWILEANRLVNEVSGLDNSRLTEHIDNDLFCENPKFCCLLAVENKQILGMCLYSDMYMANHGEGFYLANVYVLPENRRKNIFKQFLENICNSKPYNFMFAFVGDENEIMQGVMKKIGAKELDLKSYFLKF